MDSSKTTPGMILGTMTFGKQVDEAAADRILGEFLDAGHNEIDTAYAYCEGRTEEILGKILTPERREKVIIASKANPWSSGGLRPARVIEQVDTSLKRLGTDFIDILYLHAPDNSTPVGRTLEAVYKLVRDGKVLEVGLSNYAAWQVADIWHICMKHLWKLPTVYQGMYNAVTRDIEPELFPVIRNFGIRFYAYNPLAGGLLTGKHAKIDAVPEQGRFAGNTMYLDRYWKPAYFAALDTLRAACERVGIPMADAGFRWLIHHSKMAGYDRDAVIIGVSSIEHLKANLAACHAGPLPDEIVAACDAAWEAARPGCPPYFRT